MAKTVLCKFCNQRRQRSGEHIWPNWLGVELAKRGARKAVTVFRQDASGEVVGWPSISYDSEVNGICQACNTSWMNDIEARASPVLRPMIFGMTPAALSPQDQQVVATWLCLRALVMELVVDDQAIPASRYREMEHRRTTPVERLFAWIGALPASDLSSSIFSSASVALLGGVFRGADDAYVITCGIANLLFRIFLYTALAEKTGQFGAVNNHPFDRNLRAIWPPTPKALDWPPLPLELRLYPVLAHLTPVSTGTR